MRASLRAVLPAAAMILVLASTAVAAPVTFNASFNEGGGRATAHQCPPDAFICGYGTVEGFGQATSKSEFVSFGGIEEDSCGEAVFQRTITFEDGDTLVLLEAGTVCWPGKSTFAPGALKSFGNPFTFGGTFTVTGGTGTFEGATGSGTFITHSAGDAGNSVLSGTLTLAD